MLNKILFILLIISGMAMVNAQELSFLNASDSMNDVASTIVVKNNSPLITPLNNDFRLMMVNNASLTLPNNLSIPPINLMLPQKQKNSSQHGLVKVGKILTYIGAPLLVAGAIMVAKSDALYYTCTSGYGCEGDPLGAFGITALGAGIGMTGTGAVLWIIGGKKSK